MKRNGGRSLGVILVVALAIGIFLILGQVTDFHRCLLKSSSGICSQHSCCAASGSKHRCRSAGSDTPGSPGYATITPSVVVDLLHTKCSGSSTCRHLLSGAWRISRGSGHLSRSNGNSILLEDTTASVKLFGAGQESGAASITITSGRTLDSSDENSSNIIIGQQYSSDNQMYAGDVMTMLGHNFKVVGVFAGSGCDGDTVIVPYPIGSSLLNVSAPVFAYVYITSYNNVGIVQYSLEKSLGSWYSVEDLSTADHNALQNAISSILLSSQFGEYAALIAGAAVMIVVMVLVTSRRTKEIGLLKALGYGNGRVLLASYCSKH